MFLLPNTKTGFSETSYWNTFFKQRGKHPFEWYGDYTELCGILHKYIKPNDKLLVVGCGNSALSATLYDIGYKNVTNIDVSEVVVNQMQQKYCRKRPGLSFIQMDATCMTFSNDSFTSVLDKGTLDSLFSENNAASRERVTSLLNEISRIMVNCGRYVCFSLLQDFILEFLLDYFINTCWLVRVCRCVDIEKKRTDTCVLPVFSVVCVKLKNSSLQNKCVLEVSLDEKTFRRVDKDELIQIVTSIQHAEIVCDGLARNNLSDTSEEPIIEVSRAEDKTSRYTLIIKDKCGKSPAKMTFAAFIVPHGRENEWIFGTPEGRDVLHTSCGTDRLAVVLLSSDHIFPDYKGIQDELAETILKLAPDGAIRKSTKIPFMTCGEDQGTKTVILHGKSDFSGSFKVEDHEIDDEIYRRLIFLNRPTLIQSEIKLKASDKLDKNGEKIKVMDYSYISCDYHILINIGVALASIGASNKLDVLLIGLGGGVLTNFISRFFPDIQLDAVEIDREIFDIARKCFDLKLNNGMNVIIKDGIQFISEAIGLGKKYDVIIFDIDNKDVTSGISCPPQKFVQYEILSNVAKCLKTKGIFVMNMVCRSLDIRTWVVDHILSHFPNLVTLRTKEDVNEVLFCRQLESPLSITDIDRASNIIKNILQEQSIVVDDDLINITKSMKFLGV